MEFLGSIFTNVEDGDEEKVLSAAAPILLDAGTPVLLDWVVVVVVIGLFD